MKKTALASVALSALFVTSALAADLPARMYSKAPPMVAPAWNWSGFYMGVNAGYAFGEREDITTTGQLAGNIANVAGGLRPGLVRNSRDGFIGGGQMGYNWQFSPTWVFGLEADIQYVDINKNNNFVGTSGLSNFFRTDLDYLGTVRGRLGYTWGATMLYGTGGFAYGGVNNSASFLGPAGQLQFFGQDRTTRTGYTAGAGVEHMFAPSWSLKVEYLYYDLGRSNLNVALVPGGGGGGTGYNTTVRNDGHIVRAGLNYKFGGPILARY